MQADTITPFSAYLHAKRGFTIDYATEIGFICYDGFVISERKDSLEYKGRVISVDYDSYYNNLNYKSFYDGSYRIVANGLQPQTTYYYKSFSKINGGYSYGTVKSFSTGEFEKPTISSITDITFATASVIVAANNLSEYPISSIGVDYTTDTNLLESAHNRASIIVNTPQSTLYKKVGVQYSLRKDEINSGNIVYNSNYTIETTSTVVVGGLSEQTTYYYRPVYYLLKGSTYNDYDHYENVYGDVKTLVTTEAPPRQTMTITTAGLYGWTTYNTSTYSYCLRSNNRDISSSTARSILSFTVNQATSLTFGYRVSSESYYDKMTIKVDNNIICENISGSKNKSSNSVALAKGDHTITLEYTKNDYGNYNDDCGYIYNIAVNGELLANDDFK